MASAKTPKALARKCIGKLNDLLEILRPSSSAVTVHDFRVQYKRTRALLRMANAVIFTKKHRIRKSWRSLYACSGRLRDISLIIELVQKKFGQGALLQYFLEQEIVEEQQLQKKIKRIRPISINGKKWGRFKKEAVARYFETLLEPLDKSYHHTVTDKQLHTIRKNLKDLLYNIGWLKELGIAIPEVAQKFEIADIERLLELLGNYQNTVVQSLVLRHLPPIAALHEVSVEIAGFLHELAHQQSVMHQEIIRSLEHFFHLHTAGSLNQ